MLRDLLTRVLRSRLRCNVRRRLRKRQVAREIERLEVRELLATWSGNIPNGTVWSSTEVQRIVGNVHVPTGATLTIQPGTVIKFDSSSNWGISVDGTLKAPGTQAKPIIFTSLQDDTAGGDTNGDGSASTPSTGQWDTIQFQSGSQGNVLDHVEVRFGGQSAPGALYVKSSGVTVSNSKLFRAKSAGVRFENSNPTFTNITFANNGTAASMDLSSNPAISGVTMVQNSTNALRVDSGTLPKDGVWNDRDITYLLQDTVTVPAGKTLSITAGQVVKFRTDKTGITVNGTLTAQGTLSSPVVLTSVRDDSSGSDVDNDGNGTPSPVDWGALTFNSTSSSNTLQHVDIRYGGNGAAGAVVVNGGPLAMSDSRVSESARVGLRVQSGTPTLTNVQFLEGARGPAISIAATSSVAGSGLSASGNLYDAIVVDDGTMPKQLTWSASGIPFILTPFGQGTTLPSGSILTIAAGAVFENNSFYDRLEGTGIIQNAGTILGSKGDAALIPGAVVNTGLIQATNQGLILDGGVTNNGEGWITGPANSAITVNGNFLGTTRNSAGLALPSSVFMSPATTASLEAMSADLGAKSTGFSGNFTFNMLGITGNVTLVNLSDNSTGSGAEAVYANSLTVYEGGTLNLNGLHLYTRSAQLTGTVTGGTVSILPDGGPLVLDTPTPGSVATEGQVDDWTVFGRQGQLLAFTVNTGTGGANPVATPTLNFAQVQLIGPNQQVLGTASNTASGTDVLLSGITLPADGTYHLQVRAASGHTSNKGNYVVTAWNATANVSPLVFNQPESGVLSSPYRVDRYTFTAKAGQVANFNLLNADDGVQFDMTGPGGLSLFTNRTSNAANLTLSTAGTYTLTAHTDKQHSGAYAFRLDSQSVTTLTLGTSYSANLAAGSQAQVFKVNVPSTQQLQVTATDTSSADHVEVYIRFGAPPTREEYDDRDNGTSNHVIDVASAAPGDWYVLVYSEAPSTPGKLTLKVAGAKVLVSSVSPDHVGNGAAMTLTLTGAGFDGTAQVSLISSSNAKFAASSVQFNLATQITATFAAGSVPAGVYSIQVTQTNGGTATLSNAVTVKQGGQAKFSAGVVAPSRLGNHVPGVFYINYGNLGDVAMAAPMLMFTPTQTHSNGTTTQGAFLTLDPAAVTQGFWTSADPAGFSHTIQILASGKSPGVLLPGESVQVPVYYAGWQQPWDLSYPPFKFNLKVVQANDSTVMDWNSLKTTLPAPSIVPAAWDAIWANVKAKMGNTYGSFVTTLDQTAAYLGRLGKNVNDVHRLFDFELVQASGLSPFPVLGQAVDAQSPAPGIPLTFDRSFTPGIGGRSELGPLGRGWSWTGGWDSTLAVQSDGSVILAGPNGGRMRFLPDSRGGYFSAPGDQGTLTAGSGGTFVLRERNGVVTTFRANGQIASLADAHGNTVTTTYVSGRLTQLTHSSGATLKLAYNSAGRIISVTDSTGRVTTYGYDSTNEHLMKVTDFAGRVTSYTYSLGGSAVTNNALLSIGFPDGMHEFFTYDSQGRISGTHLDANAETMQYTYGTDGTVTTRDAVGGKTTVYFSDRGLIGRIDDALQRTSLFSYDAVGNLISITDPAGQISTSTYDAEQRVTRSVDPLGNAVQFNYGGTFGQVSQVIDPKGNSIHYAYDAKGSLTSTTYADGSIESLAYDPVGNVIGATDRKGQLTQATYDTAGRLRSLTFADGSKVTYVYNSRGKLTSVADASGTTTLTYDAKEQLTRVDSPGGRFLQYTYNRSGRRTRMTDQAGFVVNYSYDAVGRLSGLTDGANQSIVKYTYNIAGQMTRKDNGNGTYTTYAYDLAGQLLHEINFGPAPSNPVTSRFDSTYDVLGRVATMTTLDGVWTYSYDAVSRLTRAVFASKNTAVVPNQDLRYAYDAAGNRTSTVINGVTTNYVTNNLNQYTSIGSSTYRYDLNGNLIEIKNGSTTTTYGYDAQDQLTGVTSPGNAWSYQYDAFGNQIASTQNGQTTRNQFDLAAGLGNLVAQFNSSGALVAHFTYGLGLTSRVDTGNVASYFNFDSTGNTVALTNAAGTVVNSYRYLPFGATVTSSGSISNPFQFGGESGVISLGNGLELMRARDYDLTSGRFVQSDPLGIVGGLNLYAYAGNDPINQSDPTGLMPMAWGNTQPIAAAAVPAVAVAVEAGFAELVYALSVKLVAAGVVMNGFVQTGGSVALQPSVLSVLQSMSKREVLAIARQYFTRQELRNLSGAIVRSGAKALTRGVSFGVGEGGFWTTRLGIAGILAAEFIVVFGTTRLALNYEFGDDPPARRKWDDFWYRRLGRAYEWLTGGTYENGFAFDPNEKIGPTGVGTAGYITGDKPFPYRINFENETAATAPAQFVSVTDQLSTNLDWSTFELGTFGFGDILVTVPAGSQHYQTTVSMTFNGRTFDVQVEAGLRALTGIVFITFQSIDPTTELPPDPLTGFLPPEDGTGRGKGFLTYTISPKPTLATGTQIRNVANIIFDGNLPITTNQIDPHDPSKGTDPAKEALNTIDAGAPTSRVNSLPATNPGPAIPVTWSGSDDAGGSGIAMYDVFVSDNGGAFNPFLTGATGTSGTYTGVLGHTYGFYAVATDNVGHRQTTPTAAQATTKVGPADAAAPTAVVSARDISAPGTAKYTFTVTYSDNMGINVATLGNGDVRVTGPNSFSQLASLVSVNSSSNGSPRTATYSINVPGGSWRLADCGLYTISSVTGSVMDVNGIALPAVVLGTFDVSATTTIAVSGSTFTDNLGGTAEVGFKLPRAPSSAVTIQVSVAGSGASNVSMLQPRLTFTSSNWNVEQRVTLIGLSSTTIVGFRSFTVHADVISSDPVYSHTVIPDKTLTSITGLARVYNLYNTDANVHFYTTNKGERDALTDLINNVPFPHHPWIDSAPSYTSFSLFQKNPGGSNVGYVQRLYNSQTSEHYYTTSIGEATALANTRRVDPVTGRFVPGWIWENRSQKEQLTTSNAFQGYMYLPTDPAATSRDNPVGPAGTKPLFRMYEIVANPDTGTGDHTLSNDPDLYTLLRSSSGWTEHSMVGFAVQIDPIDMAIDLALPSAALTVASSLSSSPVRSAPQFLDVVTTDDEATDNLSSRTTIPIAPAETPVFDVPNPQDPTEDSTDLPPLKRFSVAGNQPVAADLDAFWESIGTGIDDLL